MKLTPQQLAFLAGRLYSTDAGAAETAWQLFCKPITESEATAALWKVCGLFRCGKCRKWWDTSERCVGHPDDINVCADCKDVT